MKIARATSYRLPATKILDIKQLKKPSHTQRSQPDSKMKKETEKYAPIHPPKY